MSDLQNLPAFYVGQKVVALVNSGYKILIKDQTYKVTRRQQCSKCGVYYYGVGLKHNIDQSHCLTRCSCGGVSTFPVTNEFAVHETFLAPVEEQKFPLIKLSEVLTREEAFAGAN